MFSFSGPILVSKSWLNRALVIQHFNPHFKIKADSESEDVKSLHKALEVLSQAHEFDLGLGGTTLRFFSFLISRYKGDFKLKAHPRLLQRPQKEISNILAQLGVRVVSSANEILIQSQGWKPAEKIKISASESSQFISGLLLSCWGLEFDLTLEMAKPITSFGYLKMTYDLLRKAGMNLTLHEDANSVQIYIPKMQKASVAELQPELDISSAFSLIAAGVINGRVCIQNWNAQSLQPDLAFLVAFEDMGIDFIIEQNQFRIEKQTSWKAIDFNLQDCPDLFPVLSVLCAFAQGVSTLSGAEQLKHKESNRIAKTNELLQLIGVKTEILSDGLRIYGQSASVALDLPLVFNPDHDHRMAFAAALLKLKSYNLQILHPEVVNKSYPSFWKDIGLQS